LAGTQIWICLKPRRVSKVEAEFVFQTNQVLIFIKR